MIKKPINSRIEELRKSLGLTQQDFGVKLGLDEKKARSVVHNWEQADIQVKSDDITRIAKTFHVSADWLLGISDNMTNDRDLDYVCSYIGLSVEAVKAITESTKRPLVNATQSQEKRELANSFFVFTWDLFIDSLWNIYAAIKATDENTSEFEVTQNKFYTQTLLYMFERYCRKIPELLFGSAALDPFKAFEGITDEM